MILDLRLLPVAAAVWLGCIAGLHIATWWIPLLLCACALLSCWKRPQFHLAGVAVIVGTAFAALRVLAADPQLVADEVGNAGALRFTAVVNTEPQLLEQAGFGGLNTEQSWQSHATLTQLQTATRAFGTSIPVTVRWRSADGLIEVGSAVSGSAVFHPDDVKRRSTYRLAVRGSLAVTRRTSRGSLIISRIRHSLADATGAHDVNARPGATLLPGLVLGDTSAQSRELADDLRTSGLSHLTAVSGANVAIVLGAVLWLLQRTRLRRGTRYFLLGGLLGLFVAVVQPQPSVMRAAVMGAIALFALATGATKQSAAALWLSVVVVLLIDPFMAWQYGFGLSVAATAGLIVLQPLMAERLPRNRVLDALIVTIAAQIATLPLLLVMGVAPTWASIPANVFAEPLVGPATISGFVASVIAACSLLPIPLLSPVLHALAAATSWPGVVLGDAIAWIARTGADSELAVSPFASWRSGALFVVVCLAAWRLRRRRSLVVAVTATYFLLSTCAPAHRWPPSDWWYAMCDVGQGDATVVRTGPASAIVVDAGPDSGEMRRCMRALDITSVDVLVLTHFHADHVEGVAGVVAYARVHAVLASPLHDPLLEYQRVAAAVRQPIRDLVRGERFHVRNVHVEVLWPDPTQLTGDPNNASVVMRISTPEGSVLITGDADPAAQAQLPPMHVDILKVPHHGSRYQDPQYLVALHPAVALISVGTGNDYGHPAPTTVSLLQAAGVRVLRTDRVGGIAAVTRGKRLAVAAQRG